jgi:hypothetical protein
VLAERLHEANKAAGQHSKQSHETAKRYYDRRPKLEQFKKGAFTYVYDPIHKRSKARKFSYQYKGPHEIEEKISPLLFKVQLDEGTSMILHINRLKKAVEQAGNDAISPLNGSSNTNIKSGRTKQLAPKMNNKGKSQKVPAENPPRPRVADVERDASDRSDDEISSPLQIQSADPEWIPGSSYLRKKLQDINTADDNVAHRLRSRLVSGLERETEADKEQEQIEVSTQKDEHMLANMQNETSPGKNRPAINHSYNFRSRIESTGSNSMQEK